jgi:oligo-1,6-glucosidase/alpha-glucosidase
LNGHSNNAQSHLRLSNFFIKISGCPLPPMVRGVSAGTIDRPAPFVCDMATARDRPWWERGVVYQIYPRSFQDSNGDGIGDLAGIRSRLDYIAALGVDAIWLSPIFPSPMADFGYDVADYCDVEPMFGDLSEFDDLLRAVHDRGLKLLLDFVPNHSSDQHPWFRQSRSSRESPKRDWYIWRDPAADGCPPNNWISDFGGSAWEWDEATGQYYLHAFLKEQPDLNWRNPTLRAAMMDVLRFWFDRGVDGFRIDVLWHIVKHEELLDNPPNPAWTPAVRDRDRLIQSHSTDQPEAHAISAEMRRLADGYGDRVLIGEIFLPNDRLARWYGSAEQPQVHLPFNFQLVENGWNAATLRRVIADYEASLPSFGWPNWVLGSHDAPRIAARIGDAQARVAAMLLLTLRGTPTLYQGDELGIGEVTISPDRMRDPQHHRQPELNIGRDRSRTPMPWSEAPFAGFSSVEPWLPLNDDWPARNVAAQEQDDGSLLHFYRLLLRLRRTQAALATGSFALTDAEEDVLSFVRVEGDQTLLVVLNLGCQVRRYVLPRGFKATQTLASTKPAREIDGTVGGDEGLILRLEEH